MTHAKGHGAALRLEDVSRFYGPVTAICDVDLDIAPGEFITLLGPSGSGKSTTLNIVAGFDRANRGTIAVDGNPINDLPPHKRNMGMVFQHYALFPHLTVAQNIAYPLVERRLSKTEIARRTADVLAMVRLEDYGDRYPSQISGGQQQRVALARALVFSPRVLLMDEPLGALDKKLREQLQREIRKLHREIGVTVLFVTHDQEEALALSDRIAVFNDGVIEQVGSPKELWDRPITPFVANFLGEANLIPGVIEAGRLVTKHMSYTISGQGLESGRNATLLVRPDRLKVVAPRGRETEGLSRIAGRVIESTFMGASRRLSVDCADAGLFSVVEYSGEFSDATELSEVALEWHTRESVLLMGAPGDVPTVFSRTE